MSINIVLIIGKARPRQELKVGYSLWNWDCEEKWRISYEHKQTRFNGAKVDLDSWEPEFNGIQAENHRRLGQKDC